MPINKILAVIIVLTFILAAIFWVMATIAVSAMGAGADVLKILIPGLIFFGLVGTIVFRLWKCPEPGTYAIPQVTVGDDGEEKTTYVKL